ncbi:MAG: 50S ribosomal protein L25 [Kiritimatiellae bacterium]|nr:50S ribosomal protein L25 [Kiritimatiellia bacterium]
MSSEKVIIAELREAQGSNAARRLRVAGVLPAIFNNVEGESTPIKIDAHTFMMLLRHHRGDNLLLDVQVGDDKVRKALLKEVQYNTVTGEVVHVDFLEVSLTDKITLSVEIELIGEAEGVKAGGVLEHLLREVEIECLPTDIVEILELDVSALEIGDTLSVADIKTDATITILTSGKFPVAAVALPKTADAEEAAEGDAAEAAEGDAEEAAPEAKTEASE